MHPQTMYGHIVATAENFVGLMLLGPLGLGQRDGQAAPLKVAAHVAAPAVPSASMPTPADERAGSFRGAPFVTDVGGSEPGPLQQ